MERDRPIMNDRAAERASAGAENRTTSRDAAAGAGRPSASASAGSAAAAVGGAARSAAAGGAGGAAAGGAGAGGGGDGTSGQVQDTLLGGIFTGGDAVHDMGDATAIRAAGDSMEDATFQLVIPPTDSRQEGEITGHGRPGQRQDSQIYLRLLQARPALGKRRSITPVTWARVIDKDRTYDTLYAAADGAVAAVDIGIIVADAAVSDQVFTVMDHVDERLSADAPPGLIDAFLPVYNALAERIQQADTAGDRTARGKRPLQRQLWTARRAAIVQGGMNRMFQGAHDGADLGLPAAGQGSKSG